MELSKAKIKELVDAIARDTRIDNIVAAEGYTREFVEDFAREYADEICDKSVLEFIDVIITGRYIDSLRDISHNNEWRGSTNQQIIYLHKEDKKWTYH